MIVARTVLETKNKWDKVCIDVTCPCCLQKVKNIFIYDEDGIGREIGYFGPLIKWNTHKINGRITAIDEIGKILNERGSITYQEFKELYKW